MKEIGALQYQKILFDLPNPLSVIKEGRTQEIKISYVEYPTDPTSNIIHGTSYGDLSEYSKVGTITFEIVHNQSLPFWQPKEEIKIKPVHNNISRSIYGYQG